MRYYSTSTFRSDLAKLCKKPKHGYSSLKADICAQYTEHTTPLEAIQWGDTLMPPQENDSKFLIKARIANSGKNIGKKGAFRVLYFIDVQSSAIYLLHVYPKTGKYEKDNVTEAEVINLLIEFRDEKVGNLLVELDINDSLGEIDDDEIHPIAAE